MKGSKNMTYEELLHARHGGKYGGDRTGDEIRDEAECEIRVKAKECEIPSGELLSRCEEEFLENPSASGSTLIRGIRKLIFDTELEREREHAEARKNCDPRLEELIREVLKDLPKVRFEEVFPDSSDLPDAI